jgi:hypothetical protein
MDWLYCANSNGTGNVHISNFNYGQYGNGTPNDKVHHAGVYKDGYTPWTEETAAANNKSWSDAQTENNNNLKDFSDEIMLMEGCSTSYFGYGNSRQSSNVYKDMFVRVSGNTIMAWASQQGITVPSDGNVSGMMFVGFDYEADLSHGLTDTTQGDSYLVTESNASDPNAFLIPNKQDNGNWQQGKYYKAGARDHYYSDWIIRIVDGGGDNPGGDTTVPKVYTVTQETTTSATYKAITGKRIKEIGRVMAEDLGSSDYDDVDYNDVVFDARILEDFCRVEITTNGSTEVKTSGTYTINGKSYTAGSTNIRANIMLVAAGGTIPISVAGMNVHSAFGVGKTEMVNTFNSNMTNGKYQTKDPVPLKNAQGGTDFTGYTTINDIPIGAEFMNGVIVIDNSGSVPHKLKVPVTAPWPKERIEMNTAYSNKFGSGKKVVSSEKGYVQDSTIHFWDYAVASEVNNLVGFTGQAGDEFDTASEQETKSGGTVYTVNQVDAINSSVPTVESGWTTIWTRNNDGYLYNDGQEHYVSVDDDRLKSVTSGSKIRVYGVRTAGCSVTLFGTTNSTYNTEGGYMEFTVSEINAASLSVTGGLAIYGQNFTVTNVAIKVETPASSSTLWTGNASSGSSDANSITIEGYKFNNVQQGQVLCVYATVNGSSTDNWKIYLGDNSWGGMGPLLDNWPNGNDGNLYKNTNSSYYDGTCFRFPLTQSFIDRAKNGMNISHNYLNITSITVENASSNNPQAEPTFPAASGNLAYNQVTDISNGVSINNVDVSNASEVTVTVQGTSEGNSSVSVNGVTATQQSSARQRARTRTASPVTYVATLTGNSIGKSISITGSNFTVYKVYVDVKTSSQQTTGTNLWTTTGEYDNTAQIQANTIISSGAKQGDIIRCSGTLPSGQYDWWYVKAYYYGDNNWQDLSIPSWGNRNEINKDNVGPYNRAGGYIDIVLDQTTFGIVLSRGLIIQASYNLQSVDLIPQ